MKNIFQIASLLILCTYKNKNQFLCIVRWQKQSCFLAVKQNMTRAHVEKKNTRICSLWGKWTTSAWSTRWASSPSPWRMLLSHLCTPSLHIQFSTFQSNSFQRYVPPVLFLWEICHDTLEMPFHLVFKIPSHCPLSEEENHLSSSLVYSSLLAAVSFRGISFTHSDLLCP